MDGCLVIYLRRNFSLEMLDYDDDYDISINYRTAHFDSPPLYLSIACLIHEIGHKQRGHTANIKLHQVCHRRLRIQHRRIVLDASLEEGEGGFDWIELGGIWR